MLTYKNRFCRCLKAPGLLNLAGVSLKKPQKAEYVSLVAFQLLMKALIVMTHFAQT